MTEAKKTVESVYKEIKFSDEDVVNPDDFIPAGGYNPHKVRPFLLHDHGFVICVVFADCLQDALDEAVDAGKLDRYQIDPTDPNDRDDYMVKDMDPQKILIMGFDPTQPEFVGPDGSKWWWNIEPTFMGNASEPFDIEGLSVVELPNPPFSFCALFNAAN